MSLGRNPIDEDREKGGIAFTIRGFNDAILATPAETVWPAGGIRPLPATAIALQIESASLDDTIAGTGAQKVLVKGLLADFTYVEQTIDLDGTTAVSITTPLFRIIQLVVTQAGSGNVPAGDITVTDAGTGLITYEIIQAGSNLSRSGAFCIPKDRYGYITDTFIVGGTSREAIVTLLVRGPGSNLLVRDSLISVNDNPIFLPNTAPARFNAGTDLVYQATGAGGGSEVEVAATLRIKNLA